MDQPKFNPEKVLHDFSEHGRCLLTGRTDDLVILPVNFDVTNTLPSNIAHLHRETASAMTFCCYYNLNIWDWEVTFESSPEFTQYNSMVFYGAEQQAAAESNSDIPKKFETPHDLPKIWAFLVGNHCKGVARVKHGDYVMTDFHYQAYINLKAARQKVVMRPTIVSPY